MGDAARKLDHDHITFDEFLEMEERSEQRHEYHDGELLPVMNASPKHSEIISNTNTTLKNELRKKDSKCKVYEGSLAVYFPAYNHSAYPDIYSLCGKIEQYDGKKNAVLNPLLVIEVLSPSTEDYDRGTKFTKYRSLPSFREYVLISQDRPKVEAWYKMEENTWRISHAEGMESSIHLYSLEIDLPLSELYYLVDFEEEE